MLDFRLALSPDKSTATILADDASVPVGAEIVGTYQHDTDPYNGIEDNKVHYHYVRDILYKLNILNMQAIEILYDGGTGIPPELLSVFATGFWNDDALWNDDHVWKD